MPFIASYLNISYPLMLGPSALLIAFCHCHLWKKPYGLSSAIERYFHGDSYLVSINTQQIYAFSNSSGGHFIEAFTRY